MPSEKVMAAAGIYKALAEELDIPLLPAISLHSNVQAALIDAAVRIAMATDTRDMGIMGPPAQSDLPEGYDENDPYARE
jgi:hypothetical protein